MLVGSGSIRADGYESEKSEGGVAASGCGGDTSFSCTGEWTTLERTSDGTSGEELKELVGDTNWHDKLRGRRSGEEWVGLEDDDEGGLTGTTTISFSIGE